ncbi:hypothetical protein ZWY2020_049637 [Hordeum vulgare]|nr:hypothetical protein ZWY2020_049637 [Hordeum vulgare]
MRPEIREALPQCEGLAGDGRRLGSGRPSGLCRRWSERGGWRRWLRAPRRASAWWRRRERRREKAAGGFGAWGVRVLDLQVRERKRSLGPGRKRSEGKGRMPAALRLRVHATN